MSETTPEPCTLVNGWLRPFRGVEPACPKCRGLAVMTEYHPGIVVGFDCETFFKVAQFTTGEELDPTVEHLCRSCSRCTYTWAEVPAGE